MRETWYLLENGDVASPRDVSPDSKGKLHHKSGIAVRMKGDVPHTTGVDVPEHQEVVQEHKSREVKADKPKEPKASYKTRVSKAD